MRRALIAILRWAEFIVPPVVREYLDWHLLIKLLFWNAAGLIALGRLLDVSHDTVKEFGSFWTLLVVCAALVESDLIRLLRRRDRSVPIEFYFIMLVIGAVAFGLGYHMRNGRLQFEAFQARQQLEWDAYHAKLASPDVRRGVELLRRLRRERSTTRSVP